MLLSVEEIKKGLNHPEILVREHCLRYFTDAWSTDPSIMPLVVAAMKETEWKKALFPSLYLSHLRQTPETLGWFIDELERTEPSAGDPNYHEFLSNIVAAADVNLLRSHQERALAVVDDKYRHTILDQIRLNDLDPAGCWREVEEFCEESKDKEFGRVDFGKAARLVEALGRDTASAERVMSVLAIDVEQVDGDPLVYMEGIAVGIAGEMRLQSAIPHLIRKLKADYSDWIQEECQQALSKIGGDEVAAAVDREFESSWEFRLYASDVLESNRSQGIVERALRLYEHERLREGEENGLIVSNLMLGALANFSADAIEPARKFLSCRWRQEGDKEVRERVVAVGLLLDKSFQELERWRNQCLQERQKFERQLDEWNRERLKPLFPSTPLKANKPAREQDPPSEPVEITKPIHAEQKTGRNDPCPCGSGKKFKKCCMK